MELHVLDHPLVEHKLTVLRDKNTSSATFRELVTELVMLEAYEATRNLDIVDKPIETPVRPHHRSRPSRRTRHARRHDQNDPHRRSRLPRHEAR